MPAGIDSRSVFLAIVVLVALQRLLELRHSRRNEAGLRARGAIEAGATHYPWMVALHTAFLIAGPLEVWALDRPFEPPLAAAMLGVLVAATALRYWTMRTLGERWTTRVLCLPGSAAVTGGPFRFIRHPNYLAVMLETLALPLLHGAWLTAASFAALNLILLRRRIRVEEEVLSRHTDYRAAFAAPRRGGDT